MNTKKEIKIIRMFTGSPVEVLLNQLEELTNPQSIHFDSDILAEKDEIREKILAGEIVCE